MTREFNIKVCKENRKILKRNRYEVNDRFVELPWNLDAHQKVQVITPEMVESIMNDDEGFFEHAIFASPECRISVLNIDSFGYPTSLVMNFANAFQPGGGYKSGANAQEEALCRQSTLYASIGSAKAREMYDYNKNLNDPFDSDYMLISPCVDVFRNADLELLYTPYTTAVMTIPAPDLNGRAKGQDPKAVEEIMKKRIMQYLFCAARYGYRTITLGAWGCGAFGHDAKDVARYFHEILVEEKLWEFFDEIIFAVYDKSPSRYNYNTFSEVFSDVELGQLSEANHKPCTDYIQATKPFPICNHTQQIESSNLGYCQGIFGDGLPFEAELWVSDTEKAITFIMPRLEIACEKPTEPKEQSKVVDYNGMYKYRDGSVLWLDMVVQNQETDGDAIQYYIEYLKDMGAIEFTGEMENGSVVYCTDVAGTDLAHVTIAIEEYGKTLAESPLKFNPFFPKKGEKKGKVIKLFR